MKRLAALIFSIVILLCSTACDGISKEYSFKAKVLEINDSSVIVQPFDDKTLSSDKISFSFTELEDIGAEVGCTVRVYYNGVVMESYPAQLHADRWELVQAAQDVEAVNYEGEWLDRQTAEQINDVEGGIDMKITEIYADCFFAQSVIYAPYTYKINYRLDDNWCVGDQVLVTYKNAYCDSQIGRFEADGISVTESDFELEEGVAYKPVIYLYPEAKTQVSVSLDLDGELTCTYPEYSNGWCVSASPDGTLIADGMQYNYLYWEGALHVNWDMSSGFCVRGEDTAEFLETALDKLGLNRKEANEFIVFWLPLMQNNPYNIISFQFDTYTESARLDITPKPDTLIRVFMTYKAASENVDIAPQELTAPERAGFTAVEWGGAAVK